MPDIVHLYVGENAGVVSGAMRRELVLITDVGPAHQRVIAHKVVQFRGYGAGVVARIAQQAFAELDALVLCRRMLFSPMPFNPRLENAWQSGADENAVSIKALTQWQRKP